MMRRFALLLPALFVACSGTKAGDEPPPAPPAEYHADVRALLEANCTVCHVSGGLGPFPLDNFESAKQYAPIALPAIMSGAMPPWMPDPDCRPYENERRLSDEQKEIFRSWVAGGMLEGDPSKYVPIQRAPSSLTQAGPPSLSLAPGAEYAPKTDRLDDYHCFPLDHVFEEETYLVMTNVRPTRPEIVHHVIIYLVPPQLTAQLDELDARDEGEGYTCFGGPGIGSAQNIAGWVPGSVPSMIEGDAAMRIPKGAKLVMQMHYNTLSSASVPDRTELDMWFRETQPSWLVNVQPFPHLGLEIPAGEKNAETGRIFRNNTQQAWSAVAVAPHMHLLGTRIRMSVVRGESEECLVDVPKWHFGWQQSYRFADQSIVTIAPGESVKLDCWYDNSPANQPIVDGEQIAPRTVTWGEGTLDEMCLGYLALLEPYAPVPEASATCPGFQECYDGCLTSMSPRTGCILSCSSGANPGCAQCVVGGYAQCVLDDCPTVVGETLECIDGCLGTNDTAGCVRSNCLANLIDFDRCSDPKVRAGTCDTYVSACGADL
jgi:hypothetical protein